MILDFWPVLPLIQNRLHIASSKKLIKFHLICEQTMKNIFVTIVLLSGVADVFAQTKVDSLFNLQNPLDIGLSMSIKQVRKSKEDTLYLSHKLYYRNSSGIYDSIKIGLKGRGNFRLQQCYFPPLSI